MRHMRDAGNPAGTQTSKRRAPLRSVELRVGPLWLPGSRSESYRLKCERESRSLAADPREARTLARIAKTADTRGWK